MEVAVTGVEKGWGKSALRFNEDKVNFLVAVLKCIDTYFPPAIDCQSLGLTLSLG